MVLSFRRSKKGNAVLDPLTLLVLVVVLGIVSITGYMAFNYANTDIQEDTNMNDQSKNISNNLYLKYARLMDNCFLMVFSLFLIFVLIGVFLLDTHPIFFIIAIILLISVFVVALLLANAYDDVMSDEELSQYANDFTYTSWIMRHIVEMIIATVFLVSIALFAKMRLD